MVGYGIDEGFAMNKCEMSFLRIVAIIYESGDGILVVCKLFCFYIISNTTIPVHIYQPTVKAELDIILTDHLTIKNDLFPNATVILRGWNCA